MRWIDCFGPPGVGKSALLDPLWPPRGIPRKEPPYPEDWHPFMRTVSRLLMEVENHPTFRACESMTHRSFTKMHAVRLREAPEVYQQTGFAQRGLGIGWRLDDPERVRPFFEQMPVSLGVISLFADLATIEERNRTRIPPKNRQHMVAPMERPRQICVEVMRERGVPVFEMDMRLPLADNLETLQSLTYEWSH